MTIVLIYAHGFIIPIQILDKIRDSGRLVEVVASNKIYVLCPEGSLDEARDGLFSLVGKFWG